MAKFLITVISLVAALNLVSAGDYSVHEDQDEHQVVVQEHIPILSFHNNNNKHGQYSYSFTGGNGIEQHESGKGGHSSSGSYSYTSPEGKHVALSYEAGKGGFQVLHQTPELEQPRARPDQFHTHKGWAHNTYHLAPAKHESVEYAQQHASYDASAGEDCGCWRTLLKIIVKS